MTYTFSSFELLFCSSGAIAFIADTEFGGGRLIREVFLEKGHHR